MRQIYEKYCDLADYDIFLGKRRYNMISVFFIYIVISLKDPKKH